MSITAEAIEMTRTKKNSRAGRARAPQQRTLVAGLGATGLAVARYLADRGERLLVADDRAEPPGLDTLHREWPHVPVVLERLDSALLEGVTRVVLSPGLSLDLPFVEAARQRGIEVLGDIELFARAADAPVLAVTGSNGKSTVATLLARMLDAAGFAAPVGGNLGPPALDLLPGGAAVPASRASGSSAAARLSSEAFPRAERQPDFYVLEISSFQMETTESLRPRAAAVLNVSADHLDRHGSLERYAVLKAKLLAAAEVAVFNLDDPIVRAMARNAANAMPFSIRTPLERGYSLIERQGRRYLARNGQPLVAADALALSGKHNQANALAALALAAAARPSLDEALAALAADFASELSTEGGLGPVRALLAALENFEGLPHRCRLVAERRGVRYIDDSKGTNVGASLAAIEGLAGPLILIAGGIGKGADFMPLAVGARGKVKAAVLIGSAAGELERAFAGVCPVRRAEDMPSAVAAAAGFASRGDTVLLSPACASQDQFRDYRHRGDVFAAAVEALADE